MRVLHMTPELPFEPGGGGGRGREYFLCRRLVERGHQVLNISPASPQEMLQAQALRDVGVENWVLERPTSQLREVANAVRAEPQVLATAAVAPIRALEMRVFWVSLRALAQRAVSEWRPDVVVVGHDMAAAWAQPLPASLPAVLTLHNLTWHWYGSRARRTSGIPAALLRAEAGRYRAYILRMLGRYQAAVAVSTIEAEEVRRSSPIPVSVIPTGVDTTITRPGPEQPGPPRLVFTGTLGYQPNSQGIGWFADHVWPEVLRAVPDAQLDIVGRAPPPSVLALDDRPGITVVGPVPVMGPYFDRAHAVIVPILTGAGIRVKIVEAMAAGRAIVSTSLGWEGLPHLVPGEHLLVGDDPATFAAATIRLLRDPELRRRLATQARSLAERHYDWRALGDEQEAVLQRALASVSAPPERPASAARQAGG
ncbi:MAG TPA: glycosyltransferase [Solirubrobacteraceae bacterium]|nr:glycosyltransferase [Solirubrobacteraceae bacterium]